MTEYRYIGQIPWGMSGGRTLAPGDFVDLSDGQVKDSHNKLAIDAGMLIKIDAVKPKTSEVKGVTNTNA